MIWAALKLALSGAVKFVAPWLSIAWNFVRKPPGAYIALIACILLAWWLSGSIGYSRGTADCRVAQRVIHDKQIVYVTVTKTASEARTDAHKAQNQHNQQEAQNVADQAAARPDASDKCIDADLADRLRALH